MDDAGAGRRRFRRPRAAAREGKKEDPDAGLWRLECGCGSCRLLLRLTAYVVSAVVVIELTRSPQEILWWEEVQKPLSLLEMLPVWDELENISTQDQIPPQAGRLCFLISKAPLQWSDEDVDSLEVDVNLFDTDAAISLGAISGGTTRQQDYCGFSLDEIVEASFMMGTIMDLEDNSSEADAGPCMTPLYCRRHGGDLQEACAVHREDPSCYDACYREEYELSLLLTLVNESESLPWANGIGENVTGGNGTALGCEEREEFLNEIFFEVPPDRLKVAAFINHFRFEPTKEAMRFKTVGPLLVSAVGLTGVLWVIQLANFLYHQFRDDEDELRWGEWLSRRIVTSTLILVTWLFPLAILRPVAGVQSMPEPLSDSILMVTPSAYSDMLVGILLIMVFAVPLMCFGGCCVAARCSCLAACTWMLALVLCTSAAALIGRSYWFDGFFLYVDLSMAFSFNFTWEMSMMVDLIQLLFFVSFLLEVASVFTFMARYARKSLRRCRDCKEELEGGCSPDQLREKCSTAELAGPSEALEEVKDLEGQREEHAEEVSPPVQDIDLKDPCPDLDREATSREEASNPEEDEGAPKDSCPRSQEAPAVCTPEHLQEEDAAHQVAAPNPDVISL